MRFDPLQPFPLPEPGTTYAEAQLHSAEVDAWLGLRIEAIEASLEPIPGQQAWVGLPARALQTPYSELREILESVAPRAGDRIVDLGAAYGRMSFVIDRHFAGVEFFGPELVSERVREAERCGARGMFCQDLAEPGFALPEAEVYFIYDFGTEAAIERTLAELRTIAARRRITVVGRGRLSRDRIERGHPWLSQVEAPVHRPHYSIYRTAR